MAEGTQVSATGGRNADGCEWVCYSCGEWEVRAEEQPNQSGWEVRLYDREAEDDGYPIAPHALLMNIATACLVAEAVAVAVAHVLQARGPAVEGERQDG